MFFESCWQLGAMAVLMLLSLFLTGIKTRCDRGWTANSLCPRWWAMVFSATSNSHQANPWDMYKSLVMSNKSSWWSTGWPKEHFHVYIIDGFLEMYDFAILSQSQMTKICDVNYIQWIWVRNDCRNHTKSNKTWTSFNLKRLHLQLLLVFTSVVRAFTMLRSWAYLELHEFD